MNTKHPVLRSWLINDYAVLYLLHKHGFEYRRHGFIFNPRTMAIVADRYLTDIPIDENGRYELPDGFVIEVYNGIELIATNRYTSI